MDTVTMYKTDDGALFDKEEDAQVHERMTELRQWYDTLPDSLGNSPMEDRINWDDLVEWIALYPRQVRELLHLLETNRHTVMIGLKGA